MITLRQLTNDDVADFRRVRLLGLQESPTAFGASYAQEEKMPIEELAKRLSGTPDRWVIGAFDEDMIGLLGFMRESGDKFRHKGVIWGMYVTPAFRGRGAARALLKETLARIDVLPGLRSVRLSVVTSNQVALHLYEKSGFVRYGEEADALCVDGTFHAEFHMVRKTGKEP